MHSSSDGDFLSFALVLSLIEDGKRASLLDAAAAKEVHQVLKFA